jgi:putative nucleotidyltransferase with HDIG domain
MAPADQLEGLAVSQTLVEWGFGADRELLAAGALHDVGKSLAPPFVGYRMAMTALGSLAPRLVPALSRISPTVRLLDQHAANGARMAEQAGLSSEAVRLIGEHHSLATEPRLLALQRADGLH